MQADGKHMTHMIITGHERADAQAFARWGADSLK